jgi:branched-chain amino acid transport system substrate-binding protein
VESPVFLIQQREKLRRREEKKMKRYQLSVASRNTVLVLGLAIILFMGIYRESIAVEAPKTVKIGCSIALTGPFGIGGKWVRQGYELGIKQINADGGVYIEEFKKKIPLEILFVDSESDPVKSTRRMDKLYSVDKVDVFLGGFSGNLVIPQLAVAENYKTPIIVTTMVVKGPFEKGYKYVFTPFLSCMDQVVAFFDLFESIPKDKRPKKFVYFATQDEAGTERVAYFKELAVKRNIEMAPIEMFSLASMDFSSLIINAKRAGADALFTIPAPQQGVRLIKQMKEIDWCPKLAFICRASDDNSWSKNLGKDGDYICFTGGWDHHLKLPGVEKFNQDYKKAYGDIPEVVSGTAYTCIQILADALRRSGTLEKDKVRDAIAAANMMTIMGPIKFKPNGRGEGKYLQVVTQWQNGKKELVWPTDQASAPLAYPMPPWNKR